MSKNIAQVPPLPKKPCGTAELVTRSGLQSRNDSQPPGPCCGVRERTRANSWTGLSPSKGGRVLLAQRCHLRALIQGTQLLSTYCALALFQMLGLEQTDLWGKGKADHSTGEYRSF